MTETYTSAMKQAIEKIRDLKSEVNELKKQRYESIAIVGIGCYLPGGINTPEEFFDGLLKGFNGVSTQGIQRWGRLGLDIAKDDFLNVGGFLDDVTSFDADFFGISHTEASHLDPQQRLLLEVSWRALENAGIPLELLKSELGGCFIGMSSDDYSILKTKSSDEKVFHSFSTMGSARALAAGRLAYFLGLRGPVAQLDTMCSSSLVAVHLGCQALMSKEANVILAGGVNMMLTPEHTVATKELGVLSKGGFCRSFDHLADGYVRGEGCGILVLKRLSDAICDKDRIISVIDGSAMGHNGQSNGLSAPNGVAQEEVIREAMKRANILPEHVGFIEAQGTGTLLGDAVELNALAQIFNDENPRYLGSVKTNIGHLEAASGVASIIKASLAIKNGIIPPNIHFTQFNPKSNNLLMVPVDPIKWPNSYKQRIAGVSAFGMSGTNAHVVLKQGPHLVNSEHVSFTSILTISAKSSFDLRLLISAYIDFLKNSDKNYQDICFTSNIGRSHFKFRLALIANTKQELLNQLLSVSSNFEETDNFNPNIGILLGNPLKYPDRLKNLCGTSITFKKVWSHYEQLIKKYDLTSLESIFETDNVKHKRVLLLVSTHAIIEMIRCIGLTPYLLGCIKPDPLIQAVISNLVEPKDIIDLVLGDLDLEEEQKLLKSILKESTNVDCMIKTQLLMDEDNFISEMKGIGCNEVYSIGEFEDVLDLTRAISFIELVKDLYLKGANINWNGFHIGSSSHKLVLPNYPLRGKHCWFSNLTNYDSYQISLGSIGELDSVNVVPNFLEKPNNREVEIEIKATGLNFKDILYSLGALPQQFESNGRLSLGFECSGIITRIGSEVNEFMVGDSVFTMGYNCLNSHVLVSADHVCLKPKRLSYSDAASLPVVFTTVIYGLLNLANIKSEQRILIHACAGGVGQAALQIVNSIGAHVYATSSDSKNEFLRSQGVKHVFNSRNLDFFEGIKKVTPGVHVVLNSLGAEFIKPSFDLLLPGGVFIEIGRTNIWSKEKAYKYRPDVKYFNFDLELLVTKDPALLKSLLKSLSQKLEGKSVNPLPYRTYRIGDTTKALRSLANGKNIGKVIILHDGSHNNISSELTKASLNEFKKFPRNERKRHLLKFLKGKFRSIVFIPMSQELPSNVSFFELGLTSLTALEFHKIVEDIIESTLPETFIFEYYTFESLVEHIQFNFFDSSDKKELDTLKIAKDLQKRLNTLQNEIMK